MSENKNYAERIAKGASIFFIATIASAIIGYALRAFMARNLSIAEYGLFYTVFVFVSFLLTFRDMGMNQAIVKYIPEFIVKKRPDKIKYLIIFSLLLQSIISLALAAVLFLLSRYLSINFFKDAGAENLLPLLLIFFVSNILVYIIRFTFQGFQNMKLLAITDFLNISLVSITIFILFTLFGASAENAAYGYIIGISATTLVCLILLFRLFPYMKEGSWKFDKELTRGFILFSFSIILFLSSNFIMINIDTLCLAFFMGSEAVGLYQVAAPIAQVVIYIAVAMEAALYPFVSELWARGEMKMVAKGRELLLKLSFLLTVPICLIFLSFPDIVINILFGNKYAAAAGALQVLSIGFLFFNLGVISVAVSNGIGKPMTNTKVVFFAAIFNLAANIIMIPQYGILGAAFSTTMSYFLYLIMSHFMLNREFDRRKIKFSLPYGSMAKTMVGGIITLILIQVLRNAMQLELWTKLVAVMIPALLFYACWILFAKCIDSEDVKIMKRMNMPIPGEVLKKIERIVN